MIASRYARALFVEARSEECEKEVYDQMRCFINSFNENPKIGWHISNPIVPAELRKGLITDACGAEKGSLTDRFAQLLLSNNRMAYIKHIAMVYCDIYRRANGIRNITITVADDHADNLKELFDSTEGREVESRIDHSLIGGFIYREGSTQIDASVKGQLNKIAEKLCQTTSK